MKQKWHDNAPEGGSPHPRLNSEHPALMQKDVICLTRFLQMAKIPVSPQVKSVSAQAETVEKCCH